MNSSCINHKLLIKMRKLGNAAMAMEMKFNFNQDEKSFAILLLSSSSNILLNKQFQCFYGFETCFQKTFVLLIQFSPSSCLICLFFFIFAFHSICNANNKFLCLSSPIIPWPDSRLDVNFPRRRETTVNWVMLSNQRCCCRIWLNCDA